ncbi:IPT/TIG domain-containing protein [Nocardia beijingensis]|uniref:IPT/TIG domain-containing protein n=1 Tax=Nocardia beijingensis TaxID=95162 RepID=UPI003A5CD415
MQSVPRQLPSPSIPPHRSPPPLPRGRAPCRSTPPHRAPPATLVFHIYVPAPALTSVSPSSGSAAGATTVTLTGTNLSTASAVLFGSTAAASFTVDSDTQITAIAVPGTGRWISPSSPQGEPVTASVAPTSDS